MYKAPFHFRQSSLCAGIVNDILARKPSTIFLLLQ
jgi:hypothetical protein